ncbi:MAG: hypothetical protein ABFD12_04440 [Syntrophorhabdus sp.]
MDSDTKKFCAIMCIAAVLLVLALMAQSCAEENKRRTHLGYFMKAGGFYISSDGNQLVFDGCGHEDFAECTLYRYDRKENKLYRYVHENTSMQVMGGKYWSDSQQFLCVLVPRGQNRKQLIEEMQIAIMNPDGTGLRQLTEGPGVKCSYVLSQDGKTLVFSKGRERTEGKTLASHFDLYARDLATGKEIQLTNLSFYEVGTPHFTPDGKHIVFDYYGVLRLPNGEDAIKFGKEYEAKYGSNFILRYPVDGSGMNRMPEPWFSHGAGSDSPIMMKDGSLYFRDTTRGHHYYRRSSNGEISEFTYAQLGIESERYLYEMSIDPANHWMVIVQAFHGRKGLAVEILDIATRQRVPISLPATITNITVH